MFRARRCGENKIIRTKTKKGREFGKIFFFDKNFGEFQRRKSCDFVRGITAPEVCLNLCLFHFTHKFYNFHLLKSYVQPSATADGSDRIRKISLIGKAVVLKTIAHLSLAGSSPASSAKSWGRSSTDLEQFVSTEQVGGSNPLALSNFFYGSVAQWI